MSKGVFKVWKSEHFEKLSSFVESKGFQFSNKTIRTGRVFKNDSSNNSNNKATKAQKKD